MIARTATGAGLFLLALGIGNPAYGQTDAPAQLARALVLEQDQIPFGKTGSVEAVGELRGQLSLEIRNAPDTAWKDHRNGQALVIHLLNRGNPKLVRDLVARQVDLGDWRTVVDALLASQERTSDGIEQLNKIEAKTISPAVAAHFALTQAISLRSDPAKSLAKLAEAKLLHPGGFVDESASRREVELLLDIGRNTEAIRAATRYLWRFSASLYADGVVRHLAEAVIPELAMTREGRAAIEALFGELPIANRLQVLLGLAHGMLLKGKLDVAAYFANSARSISSAESKEGKRSDFVATLAGMFNSPSEDQLGKLRAMMTEFNSQEDVLLIDVATALLTWVRGPITATPGHSSVVTPATEAADRAIRQAQAVLENDRR